MTTYRVQRLKPCEKNHHGVSICSVSNVMRCGPSCNGDGFKWVTVCEYEDDA